MKYLLYCIVQRDLDGPPPASGICVVAAQGLAAVVSQVPETVAAPGVPTLLAFAGVVKAIHAAQAVIPLRYGCVLESEAAIIRLLEAQREEYEALFERLRGMTEMGIRVLCQARPVVLPRPVLSPGAAHLASLRKRYHSPASLAPDEAQLADRIAASLAGCFSEQRRETSAAGEGHLLSLYFLIARTEVERFRNKARQISLPDDTRLLQSGPWPPYNFTASAE